MNPPQHRRRWGAELGPRGVTFRVFAPESDGVEVVVGEESSARTLRLERDDEPGTWSATTTDVGAGDLYRFRLAPGTEPLPDPASRFQPRGVFGPSEVIDPGFPWTDAGHPGIAAHGRVLYELHVGTFTREGTWRAARQRLPSLQELGVTVIELMPVAEFGGAYGWGYDGVFWFAPFHRYGRPDELREFVDEAHRLGLGVILDVVYNHLGDVGNVLPRFSKRYSGEVSNEWGAGLDFAEGAPMRAFARDNVAYWIDEFHLDGFRFDATQSIVDTSTTHVLVELVASARAAAPDRSLLVVGENEPQDARLVRPAAEGGADFDALWNDDFHHTARVALTGRRDAYFSDYTGQARELAAAVRHGFLFQGQRSAWQKHPRGRSTRGLPPRAFVTYLENHDQIANEGLGDRLWKRVSPGRLRALTTLLLLGPQTPLLFQGQEWNATADFPYFADLDPSRATVVREGRAAFLSQFPRFAARADADGPDDEPSLDPSAPETFDRSHLDWDERALGPHARALRLHTDLLALRREDPTLAVEGMGGVSVDAVALDERSLVVRYHGREPSGALDRLLVVNLGVDAEPRGLAEPLIAPPRGARWRVRWSSDDLRYGGPGVRDARPNRVLFLPGEAAALLIPEGATP